MRIIATIIAMLLTVGSMAQVNKRSDTFIQQDVGLDVTSLLAVPKTDNFGTLSGFTGAPVYFNPINKRLHAHDGTSWIPFAQYNEVVRTTGAQTINGIKNFTSPVYGPQAVADGQYVTREQVLPLAMTGTGIVRLVHAPRSAIFNSSSTSTSETLKIGNSATEWEYTMPAGLLSGHSLVEMEFIMELTTTSPTSANEMIPEIMIYDGSTVKYRQLHVLSWKPNRDNRDGSNSMRMKCKITFLNRSGNVVFWTVEGTKSVVQRYWGQPVGGGSNTDIYQRVGVTDYIINSDIMEVSNNITLKLRKTHPSGVIPGLNISILPLTIKAMDLNVPIPDPM